MLQALTPRGCLQATIPNRLIAKAAGRVNSIVRSTLIVNMAFLLGYSLLRRPVLRAFIVHFGGQWAM